MKPDGSNPCTGAGALLLLGLLLLCVPAFAAPKTDVVTLRNGDVITCEIKEMAYGKLRAKTNDMGTLSIEWDKVARVVSRYRFLVKLNDGTLIYGMLPDSGEDNVLSVVFKFETEAARVPMGRVVSIESIRYDLWERFNLSLSAGYNWTKASETSRANFAGSADYKGQIHRYGISASTVLTSERDDHTTRRQDLSLYWSREVSGRLQGGVTSALERNDQLGLALRTSAGLNMGYMLIMNPHLEFSLLGGVTANREWANLSEPYSDSSEGVFSAKFTFFRYDSPKTNLSAKVDVFPSLTVTDRVRFEFDTTLRHEVVSDFFVELEYYESRDNHPPTGTGTAADRGVVFSLGWTK